MTGPGLGRPRFRLHRAQAMAAGIALTVTEFCRAGQGWSCAAMETVVLDGDIILVAGQTERVESFSRLP